MEDADILWPSRPYPANLQTLNSEPCTLSLTSGRLPTIFGEAILTAKELVRSCPCLPLTMAVTESMMQQLRLSGVADPKEAVLVPSAGMTLWILEVRAVLVPSAGMTLWILEVRAVLVPSAGMTLWILEVRAVLVPSAGMMLWILEVRAVLVPSAGMTLWILEVRAVLVPSAGMTLWILEVRVAGWNRVVDTGGTGGGYRVVDTGGEAGGVRTLKVQGCGSMPAPGERTSFTYAHTHTPQAPHSPTPVRSHTPSTHPCPLTTSTLLTLTHTVTHTHTSTRSGGLTPPAPHSPPPPPPPSPPSCACLPQVHPLSSQVLPATGQSGMAARVKRGSWVMDPNWVSPGPSPDVSYHRYHQELNRFNEQWPEGDAKRPGASLPLPLPCQLAPPAPSAAASAKELLGRQMPGGVRSSAGPVPGARSPCRESGEPPFARRSQPEVYSPGHSISKDEGPHSAAASTEPFAHLQPAWPAPPHLSVAHLPAHPVDAGGSPTAGLPPPAAEAESTVGQLLELRTAMASMREQLLALQAGGVVPGSSSAGGGSGNFSREPAAAGTAAASEGISARGPSNGQGAGGGPSGAVEGPQVRPRRQGSSSLNGGVGAGAGGAGRTQDVGMVRSSSSRGASPSPSGTSSEKQPKPSKATSFLKLLKGKGKKE